MNKTFSRLTTLLSAAALFFILFAGNASAHVTVSPNSSAPGSWETYSIKIPSEKDLPTTKIALKVPEGFDFKQYQPVPDWKVELTKDESGKITTVTWSAEKDGIGPGEFQKFEFVGKNPDHEADLAWNAFQYYSDGSIVEWTGEEGSDTPHSITKITNETQAGGTESQGHDHHDVSNNPADQSDANSTDNSQSNASQQTADPAQGQASGTSTTSIILSIAALIISIIALFLTLRRTKR
ncbi:YcnI family protein [Paenibacillus sp. D2_2]|uniref:YcnI family copper-binding membrane protein n=1 Tax=Paenibacillus sp. D2_2 TaxID=3073092 RepID=UPI0028162E6C|nr:YcnI family protein [Paenibacillus sp. D2_2]WMT41468.1 YcnI family protein [Paenibacillus sp. D2_2]